MLVSPLYYKPSVNGLSSLFPVASATPLASNTAVTLLLRALRPAGRAGLAPAAARCVHLKASTRYGGRPYREPVLSPTAATDRAAIPTSSSPPGLSGITTAAQARAAAAADAARRRAPVSEILEEHARIAFRGFCGVHDLTPEYEHRAVGTATKPKHVCLLHLPLPVELHRVFGYTKLIRSSEKATRKKDAVHSAIQVPEGATPEYESRKSHPQTCFRSDTNGPVTRCSQLHRVG